MKNSSNYKILTGQLKEILKKKGIKYSQIASELEMSESSIKRLMSAEDAPLSKLEELCEIAGITIFDLMELCKEEALDYFRFTKEQSKFFTKKPEYFEFFSLIYENKKPVDEVQKEHGLTDFSVMLYLKKLEELGLLERHAKNKVKFLVKGSIDINEVDGLGKHLIKKTLENFTQTVLNPQRFAEFEKQKLTGTFQMSETYVRKETGARFCEELASWLSRLHQTSSREEKIYSKDELVPYSQILVNIPMKLYVQEIPNIKKPR